LDLIEGEAELTGSFGALQLIGGEAAVAKLNEPAAKVPVLSLGRAIQWFLYYPGVLDPDDLEWSPLDYSQFERSIRAYLIGDISRALAELPPLEVLESEAKKVY
jgi:hypothetical protein